jgi:hypothetical protein
MSSHLKVIKTIPIGRVFLDNENPRFEQVESEREAIERLCAKENVLPLATDIVKHGLNPLETFALIATRTGKKASKPSYVVAEGNRRLCALKLLNDPDLAPTSFKKSYRELAKGWKSSGTISGIVFKNKEEVAVWLQRMHQGEQGGVGRKRWSAEQQQRFGDGGRNKVAQEFLDYAEGQGLITPEQRSGKITTVQRFLTNETFREALGLDKEDPDSIRRTRSDADFRKLAKRFVDDLVDGKKANSRMNRADIVDYARKLKSVRLKSKDHIKPAPLTTPTKRKSQGRSKPQPPPPPRRITHEVEIEKALKTLGIFKLESLYHSITTLELEDHTPLLAVATWSFVETLTACMKRKSGTDFHSYLNLDLLNQLGFTDKTDKKTKRTALKRIQDAGNQTKHHATSATFDGIQLHNDMETLTPLLIKCIEEAIKVKK